MNIELGIRLTDSNYDYENLNKNENLSKSFVSEYLTRANQKIITKNFFNKFFFFWATKAMKISNKKILKIKLIHYLIQSAKNI